MTREDFIRKVAKDTGAPYVQSKQWVNAVMDSLADALINEDVIKMRGLCTFEHCRHKARSGRNASTGERIVIPPRTVIKFIPSTHIAEAIKDIPVPEKD